MLETNYDVMEKGKKEHAEIQKCREFYSAGSKEIMSRTKQNKEL